MIRHIKQGWFAIQGELTVEAIRALNAVEGPLQRLAIGEGQRLTLTIERAKRLRALKSVDWLWLWTDVTRGAMHYVLQTPGLRVLDLLCISRPGTLGGFEHASDLQIFRANHYLSEADVLAVTKCASLREIGIQSSELTHRALEALLSLPQIGSLDLEGTSFDDSMAPRMSRSTTLTSVDLGGTTITRRGFEHIVSMPQLRSLDLWDTRLTETDLELLKALPVLEYISLGGHGGVVPLEPSKVVDLLLSLPSLERVWLDGVAIDAAQEAALKARLKYVRISEPDVSSSDDSD